MIRSMTSFARESLVTDRGILTVEIRTVNHRYLDSSFKLPEGLRQLEPKLREQVTKKLARGKFDCLVRLQTSPQQAQELNLNRKQLDKLLQASAAIEAELTQSRPLSPLEILQFPGIYSSGQGSEEELLSATQTMFKAALASLVENRQREGEQLGAMVLERLTQVEREVFTTRGMIPELMAQQRQRIIARIAELNIEIDGNRLEQELVHLANKADVDEELDRLEAHIVEVRRTLAKGGPCGRRLDFLMQEFNREANTLSSKSQSSSTTQSAVELKVLIEQMREQIQNIE
jgi:uncharacterized protein (TIGR00255 family)